MKKYKLIKCYPQSPQLGTIIEFGRGWGNTEAWIKDNPEAAKEFWEEVINWDELLEEAKRKYPIGTKITSLSGAKVVVSGTPINYSNDLEDPRVNIRVDSPNYTSVVIYRSGKWAEIIEPVLTSEDGVKMYEGNKYWFVFTKVIEYSVKEDGLFKVRHNSNSCISKESDFAEGIKVFSSKEAAEKWCEDNKPKPKEYEILSFKQVRGLDDLWLPHWQSGWSRNGKDTTPFSTAEILQRGDYNIHSVKRLSDGEVFTIGDLCCPKLVPDNIGKITTIEFCKTAGYLRLEAKGQYYIDINDLVKVKPFSYTTEDGVVITNPEFLIYGVSTKNWVVTLPRKARNHAKGSSNNYKFFFSEKGRSEYISEYKPMYSKHDVIECLKDDHFLGHQYSIDVLENNLFDK